MVGSPDYFNPSIDGAVNAALSLRQPGSAIKPVTYAAALDPRRDHPLSPASVILDIRTSFTTNTGAPYVPANYDNRFHGPVSVRDALARSYNVPAVRVLDYVGVERMVRLANDLGLSTFQAGDDLGLALTLGGGEVRLLELTAAFSAFANGGHKVEPFGVLAVQDAAGVLRHRSQSNPGPQVLDSRVAFLITDILSDNEARAPAFGSSSVLALSRPAAVKTGTSSDWRDNWTVGYTPQLAVGVWAGNADGRPMLNISGVEGAGPIWHDFMETALRGQPAIEFVEPAGLEHLRVCALSGLLPTPHCPHTKVEVFISGTAPTQLDDWYRPVELDMATERPAGPDTPRERIVEEVFVFPPAEAWEWARDNGWPLPPEAAQGPTTGLAPQGHQLIMTSPDPGTVYHISSAVPAASQSIRVSVRPSGATAMQMVNLYVDGSLLTTLLSPPYEAFWQLSPGQHAFSARGHDANGNILHATPVTVTVIP
jgi:membrane carboxypeptidase/penicillin-binding protein PbpC